MSLVEAYKQGASRALEKLAEFGYGPLPFTPGLHPTGLKPRIPGALAKEVVAPVAGAASRMPVMGGFKKTLGLAGLGAVGAMGLGHMLGHRPQPDPLVYAPMQGSVLQ
jgi:hypothetical protein